MDIFISYKKERRDHAFRLAAILEAYGYDVWWDYELSVGPDFRLQIEAKLKEARAVIVLWCSGARRSKFVIDEATRSDRDGKLIPAYLEWVDPPLGLGQAHGQTLVNWVGEAGSETLAGLLKALEEKVGKRKRSENVIRIMDQLPPLPSIEPIEEIDADELLPPDLGQQNASPNQSPTSTPIISASKSRWTLIETSLDVRDFEDFLEVFPKSPEAFEARVHIRKLRDWSEVDQTSIRSIQQFLKRSARGATVFEALNMHAKSELGRLEIAAEKAAEERKAATKVQELKYGAQVAAARQAAIEGKPVSTRLFKLELDQIASWPTPTIVVVPPGIFQMGTKEKEEGTYDDERPEHEVKISNTFALGQHAVTFGEYDAYCASVGISQAYDEGWGRGRHPVINVSWEDAQAYLFWLNEQTGLAEREDQWRLPSEAEWEYACRAGTTTSFSFGDIISTDQANYDGSSACDRGIEGEYLRKTVPVGSYQENAFGLHDMHGNVWEWCADVWHGNYKRAPKSGSAWLTGGDVKKRIMRGGCWTSYPRDVRSALRMSDGPSISHKTIGFRIARTL